MIGIYLLVSIFVQLSPFSNQLFSGDLSFQDAFGMQSPADPVEVALAFDTLNGVRIGTPVLFDGRQIGRVTAISQQEKENDSYQVAVQILPEASSAAVHGGTIALQAAPMSASRLNAETVVELMSMPGVSGKALKGGETLTGYSSVEQFWNAGIKRRG